MSLKLQSIWLAMIVLLLGSVQPSQAALIFFDDFGTTGAQSNWAGDSFFQSIPQPGNAQGSPSIDLVGLGYFGNLAFQGNSVDLDGTTGNGNNPAGQLQSIQSLVFGDYTVSFMLAGNLRGATPQTTTVSIGNQSFSFVPLNAQPYTLQTLYFTGASGFLTFADLGPSNQQGNLIDNVSVTTGVPEPSTWLLMLLGFTGLAFARYRRNLRIATA